MRRERRLKSIIYRQSCAKRVVVARRYGGVTLNGTNVEADASGRANFKPDTAAETIDVIDAVAGGNALIIQPVLTALQLQIPAADQTLGDRGGPAGLQVVDLQEIR